MKSERTHISMLSSWYHNSGWMTLEWISLLNLMDEISILFNFLLILFWKKVCCVEMKCWTIIHSFRTFILDCCNPLLFGVSQSSISHFQMVRNVLSTYHKFWLISSASFRFVSNLFSKVLLFVLNILTSVLFFI